MLGTLVNTAAVLVGSCIGLLFRKGLPERFGQVIMKGLGLCVMYIGVKGALKGENEIIAILSIAVGAVIGELRGWTNGWKSSGVGLNANAKSGRMTKPP